MHEHQLSQFRPGESQRSRNVPDVLFVDEDGNPIEAGEENLIFVDEAGVEMSEEKAIKLIESGKYIDSRVLYDDDMGFMNRSNSMNYAGSIVSSASNALIKSNSVSQPAHKSNSLTHAQMQAQSKAKLAASLSNNDLIQQQLQIFAEAHAKARAQADELAQIEADAYESESSGSSAEPLPPKQSELQKTRSDRRLPIRPNKKTYEDLRQMTGEEETFELDNVIKEQEMKMKKSSSFLQTQKSNSFHVKQQQQQEAIFKQQQEQLERQARKEEQEREQLTERLLRKQQELMEQHLIEKRQQELQLEKERKEKKRKQLKELEKRQKEADKRQREYKKLLIEEERRLAELNKRQQLRSNSGMSKASSLTKLSHRTSASSFVPKPTISKPTLSNATKKSLDSLANDYDIHHVTQVGQLSGKNMIRNLSQVDMSQFEKYYPQLEFEPLNLDTKPSQFIDPFSPDLFKDEIVDIDFGAIDAFTEALNAQIVAEKNGTEAPKDLRFPSHVIASNHASFLDNQLFLGDSSANVDETSSGVNVQFISPAKHSQQQQQQQQETSYEKAAKAQYSRNQSFGSLIDVQSFASKYEQGSVLSSVDQFIQQNNLNKPSLSRNYSHRSLVR